MSKFNIKLDMTNLFKDERRYSIIMVDPEWPSVKSLRDRIDEIYDVSGVYFVTDDGFFVPLEEPIAIIKNCQYLRVLKSLYNPTYHKVTIQSPLSSSNVYNTSSNKNSNGKRIHEVISTSTIPYQSSSNQQTTSIISGSIIKPISESSNIIFRCNLENVSEAARIFHPTQKYIPNLPTITLPKHSSSSNLIGSSNSNLQDNVTISNIKTATIVDNTLMPLNSNNQRYDDIL